MVERQGDGEPGNCRTTIRKVLSIGDEDRFVLLSTKVDDLGGGLFLMVDQEVVERVDCQGGRIVEHQCGRTAERWNARDMDGRASLKPKGRTFGEADCWTLEAARPLGEMADHVETEPNEAWMARVLRKTWRMGLTMRQTWRRRKGLSLIWEFRVFGLRIVRSCGDDEGDNPLRRGFPMFTDKGDGKTGVTASRLKEVVKEVFSPAKGCDFAEVLTGAISQRCSRWRQWLAEEIPGGDAATSDGVALSEGEIRRGRGSTRGFFGIALGPTVGAKMFWWECVPGGLCCSWLSRMLVLLQLLLFVPAKGGGGTCKDTPTLKSDVSYGPSALKRVIMILL
ncbi:hypothetical protein LR48_Vigan07g167100 [Vigna angularis]|uniref:Uncharacterized protein n=1 Tax=Phaseolus angularis TaxID=3914 RepID=A0A0L9UZH5_PHAAN|nr:hypothetical protein LR48_Vigan07g167100 [Vigna angularis]